MASNYSPSPPRPRNTRTRDLGPHRSFTSPSSASSATVNRQASSYGSNSNTRKRPRSDSRYASYASQPKYSQNKTSTARHSGTLSPPPLANSTYRLAGGLDTPTLEASNSFEELDERLDADFRSKWGEAGVSMPHQSSLLDAIWRERNGQRKRGRSDHTDIEQTSWGQYVVSVMGGLAGKMWNFCRTNAFQGFVAGEGPTHRIRYPPEQTDSVNKMDQTWVITSRKNAAMPGEYPEEEEIHMQRSDSNEHTDYRPAKRLQMSKGDGWIMVDQLVTSRTSSPRTSSARSNRSLLPRPAARRTTSGHRATPSIARLSSVTITGSPTMEHRDSASTASARTLLHHTDAPSSPISPEIQRFAAQREREARQAEASMRKLNQQLKAMIREGREALSTRVEVHDEIHDAANAEAMNSYDDEKYEMDRDLW